MQTRPLMLNAAPAAVSCRQPCRVGGEMPADRKARGESDVHGTWCRASLPPMSTLSLAGQARAADMDSKTMTGRDVSGCGEGELSSARKQERGEGRREIANAGTTLTCDWLITANVAGEWCERRRTTPSWNASVIAHPAAREGADGTL